MLSKLNSTLRLIRTHRGKIANGVWAAVDYVWYPAIAFTSTPFLLRNLGAEHYGIWMLFMATITMGTLLNVGTGASTIKQISSALGTGEEQALGRIVRSSLATAWAGGLLMAVLILAFFSLGGSALFDKMGSDKVVLWAGVAAAVLACIEQIDNVFASALKGAEQYGVIARIELIAKTLQALVVVLIIQYGGGLVEAYAAFGATAACRTLYKAKIAKTTLQLDSLSPSWQGVENTLLYSKWGWLQGIGGALFSMADRLIIGSALGGASLASYSIATQLAMPIHALSAAALSVIFPVISKNYSYAQGGQLKKVALLCIAINLFVSTIPAVGLIVFGPDIVKVWLGKDAQIIDTSLLTYLAVAYWILGMNVSPYYILLGRGRMKIVSLVSIITGILGLLPLWFGVHMFGLMGAVIGKLLFTASLSLMYYFLRLEIKGANA